MNEHGTNWYLDLLGVVFLTALSGAAIYVGIGGAPRIALGLPLVVFLPGYALTAVLFPAKQDGSDVNPFDDGKKGLRSPLPKNYQIDGAERLGLSVGLSIAVVPAVAFVSNFTEWGIALRPILFGLCGATITLALLALALRSRLPVERRYGVSRRPLRSRLAAFGVGRTPLEGSSGRNRILNGVLAASVLLFVASVGFAIAYPPQDEGFTEFYVQTDNVTGDTTTLHTSTFPRGESTPLTVGIENREGDERRYTVVAELQRVQNSSGISVEQRADLARADVTVGDGETRNRTLDIRPTFGGDNLRLQLFLYQGDAPANPSEANAYRTLTLWVTVDSGGNAAVREPSTTLRADGGSIRV